MTMHAQAQHEHVDVQACLDDFTSYNVDAAAALVESAGRFLYRHPESHTRMANMLEVRFRCPIAKGLERLLARDLDPRRWAAIPCWWPHQQTGQASLQGGGHCAGLARLKHHVLARLWR